MDEKRSVQISYVKQPVENCVAINIKSTVLLIPVNIITKGKKYVPRSKYNCDSLLHNSLKYSMYSNFTYSGHAAVERISLIHKQNAIILWDTEE